MGEEDTNPYYEYTASSNSFLERARELIARFDETQDPCFFFYCALELRMGIEARLFEYLEAAARSGENLPRFNTDYNAEKLLKKLGAVSKDALEPTVFTVTLEGDPSSASFEYTPVTPELARMHNRLGGFLHFNFFRQNPNWLYRFRLKDRGSMSLADHRDFLGTVTEELAKACRGDVLYASPIPSEIRKLLVEQAAETENR
jgi:hypothetical protein